MKKKEKILVVEDERFIAENIKRSLEKIGYSVPVVVSSGRAALNKTKEILPDLVLMDIVLPGKLNGIDTADQIRCRYNIPVVYLTAFTDKETLERAKVSEPFGYIVKPFEERELLSTIEMALYKHRMDMKLKESEEKYRNLVERANDGITIIQGKLVKYANPRLVEIWGGAIEEIIDTPFTDYIHSDALPEAVDRYKWHMAGEDISPIYETVLVRKDGSSVYVELNAGLITYQGKPAALVFVRDISERKKAEEEKEKLQAQLLQTQKLEAIGILAGGVAHDFNNILTAMKGFAQLAMLKIDDSHPLHKNLEQIQFAATRAADLTRQLLLFSRRQPMKPVLLNVNKAIENLLKMLKRLIGEDIAITTDLKSSIWTIKADAGSIDQLIMNLTVNAKDAMPEGGKLFIKTENVVLHDIDCKLIPKARPGMFVRLSITDTGIGMDKEILDRIFEPFFTTKEFGKGSGLGLAVVHGIVKQHNGWINVYSKRGPGTTFKVYLPALSVKANQETEDSFSLHKLQGNGQRILLVEDEQAVRTFASIALSENGYMVYEASSSQEALNVSDREKGNFHLIFSDVVLPDKNGIELVDQLLIRKPELRVLLSSGYSDQKSHWSQISERGFPFLPKPFGIAELLRAIGKTLKTN